jgi:hypothetical protein
MPIGPSVRRWRLKNPEFEVNITTQPNNQTKNNQSSLRKLVAAQMLELKSLPIVFAIY